MRTDILYPDVKKAEIEPRKYPKPKQSANALFNFMPKLKYLKMILRNSAIIPRYFEEDISYLRIDIDKISIPVTCFCDINLHRIEPHTKQYGKFGIAFNKEWCIEKGIQPIQYINEQSQLTDDYRQAYFSALNYQGDNKDVNNLQSYLLSQLVFIKPIWGPMPRNNRKSLLNFHDEKEWRYIPDISKLHIELSPFLVGGNNTEKLRKLSNNALIDISSSWLKFKPDDIKYLIVKNENTKSDIISYIFNNKKIEYSDEQKKHLISKIIVLTDISEDW